MNDVNIMFQPQGNTFPNHTHNGWDNPNGMHMGHSHSSSLGESKIAGYSTIGLHEKDHFLSSDRKASGAHKPHHGNAVTERAFTTRSDGSLIHAGLKLPVLPANATEAEKHAALHNVTNSLLGASSLSRATPKSLHNSAHIQTMTLGTQPSGISSRDFGWGGDEIAWGGGDWDLGGGGIDTNWGGWSGGGSSHGGGGWGYDDIDPTTVAHGMPYSHLAGDTSKGNWTTEGPIGHISGGWQYVQTAEAVEANYKLLGVPPSPDDLDNVLDSVSKHDHKKYKKGHSEVLENHIKDLVAHGTQAHDIIKQIYQGDTGKEPDEATIKSWQDKLGDANTDLTIADIKKSIAQSQETATHLKDTLTHMTGDPSLASDELTQYYQNQLGNGTSWNDIQDQMVNSGEVNGWLESKTKFMTGDSATDSQMNYYHEKLKAGASAADITHDIANGGETAGKISATLTHMTGDSSIATAQLTQYYETELNNGMSWNDIQDQMVNSGEVNDWLQDKTKFMTGDGATDSQMNYYHERLKAGASAADITHDIANGGETAGKISATLTHMTGDSSIATAQLTQYYETELNNGMSWNDIQDQMVNSGEVNDWLQTKTKFMTGDGATDSQMNYYHEKLKAGASAADITHDIANGGETAGKISATLTHMTGDSSIATAQLTQYYETELNNGMSWNDIQDQMVNSGEVNDWLQNKTKFMTGDGATDSQMNYYHEKLKAGASAADITHDIANGGETAGKISATLTHMTGDSSIATAQLTQYYETELGNGMSWNDIQAQMANSGEVNGWLHSETLTMLGQDATDQQMAQFHDDLNAGKGSDAIIHEIAYSETAQNKFSAYLASNTQNQVTATQDFKNYYSEELANGKDLNTIHTEISHSSEVTHWQAQQAAGHKVYVVQTSPGMDRALTYGNEGGTLEDRTNGYVPKKGNSSGVTIGYGVDLAHFIEKDLLHMGVPQELLDRIPEELFASGTGQYGLRGDEARAYVSKHQLDFNQNEVDYISSIVYNDFVNKISHYYDRSDSDTSFNDLPTEAKSVMVDVGYNAGPNYRNSKFSGLRQIWQDFVNHDYKSARAHILSYFGPNDNRAQNDAKELDKIIS